ncbi:MAG: hypothetical protein L6V85_05940 [Clostridiales bacterium]|nr:MAG: hypothetical protein L6V85_05940 [Clostridiales bacterium]
MATAFTSETGAISSTFSKKGKNFKDKTEKRKTLSIFDKIAAAYALSGELIRLKKSFGGDRRERKPCDGRDNIVSRQRYGA